MASYFVVFVCLQAMCLQHIYANCIPSPKCGCSSQVAVTETCVQNPYFLNQPCQCAGFPVVSPCGVGCVNYGLPAVPGTTIIQDGSIANDLANTLQLLIVSNLLGNTLPCNDLALGLPIAQPAFGCGCGCGGINYVY